MRHIALFPKLIVVLLAGLFISVPAHAQDDLMDMLGDEETIDYATATFKATRIINLQSVEAPAPGVLQFVIQHRFGRINQGAYELFGLDNATIRLGLDYGINDWLSFGIGRSSFEKTYDGSVKIKILRQSTGKKEMPISLVWYSGMYINGLEWAEPERENYFSSRLSYAHQLLIARKFSSDFSFQIVPGLVHYNLVDVSERDHDLFSISAGGRYKINNRFSINAEYCYQLPRSIPDDYVNSFSIGVDIETGGHVFQLHLTNSQGMFEPAFLHRTTGKWSAGDIYFGFNISRVFTIVDKRETPEDW
jgi:hypothetical protein